MFIFEVNQTSQKLSWSLRKVSKLSWVKQKDLILNED